MDHSFFKLMWCGAVVTVVALLIVTDLPAGTTGKVSGTVLDQEKRPVMAATIVLAGTRLGAYSDAEGLFNILNVPPGTYEVTVSRLGFETVRLQNVVVSADQTTRVDIGMGETTLVAEEVVVTAERPPVELNLTSTKASVSAKEIESLPVQDLQDVVNLQAGVVDGHVRGGRIGEVQYQVDGVSVNDAFDNSSMLKVDRSLLQEVQVISGTFDAEYGQAMSGVVNAVLKQGTEDFQWNAEAFTGGFVFPGNDGRLTDDTIRPTAVQNYQLSLSGPTPLPDTIFLINGRRYLFDDFVYGTRIFTPTDSVNAREGFVIATGDGKSVPLGYSKEWSGVAKLTNTSFRNLKLNYQAIFNHIDSRRTNFLFQYNPDGLSTQRTFSISHGLDATYTLGPSTFLNLSLRQNLQEYEDFAFEDLYDGRYDEAGPPEVVQNFERAFVVGGIDFTRFRRKTETYLLKSSLTSQVTPEHLVKFGGELLLPAVEFGTPGHLNFVLLGGRDTLVRDEDDPPDYPGMRQYYPLMGAGFVQDQIEMSDLLVRAGFRLDVLSARSTIPSDLANPANLIEGAPESVPQNTTAKISLSPRLGVAYPIEDKAAVHVAYGHFYQFPSISDMFSNADYSILANLQAGNISFGVLGNPDVKPERTVQYEIGYKHALSQDFGFDLTTFYKDIRDLLGVEFIETYNGAEYARLTNLDFGNIFGITLSVIHRRIGSASVSLDYTWQKAMGNSSDPRETANRAAAEDDPRPRLIPFNWDQRHTLNMTVALAKPDDYSVSAVLRVASGQPYTPALEIGGFDQSLAANSGRKPAGVLLDLRAEKSVGGTGLGLRFFGRVFNVLDSRYFNSGVFNTTGSPYYSRVPEADFVALLDPGRFYPPRRIEIGFRIGSGGF